MQTFLSSKPNVFNIVVTIEEIILNKQKMTDMGKNALKISTKDAEDKIYDEIRKLVK